MLQTGFLQRFGFQASNADRFAQQLRLGEAEAASSTLGVAQQEAAAARANRWGSGGSIMYCSAAVLEFIAAAIGYTLPPCLANLFRVQHAN